MPFPIKLQLQYKIDCPLSDYQKLIKEGKWSFPPFDGCCAICKAAGCAKRHGFYERVVVEGDGIPLEISVARYLCHRKGKVGAGRDQTFSLLPHVVIPYRRYSAPVHYEVFRRFVSGGVKEVLDDLQAVLENFCERTVFWMVLMFQVAFHLLMQAQFIESTERWQPALISLVDSYKRGLPGLMVDFYRAENRFLLGTPSQDRNKPQLEQSD